MKKALETLDHAGLKLNHEKCLYKQSELKLLGHLFSKEGVQANPEKVKAIEELPQPDSVTKLRHGYGTLPWVVPTSSELYYGSSNE